MPRARTKVLVPLAILAVGGAGTVALVLTKPEPTSTAQTASPHPVETVTVRRETAHVTVSARGTVEAAQRVQLTPQVRGPVVWLNENLEPGSMVKEGEPLIRVDPRDYRLAVKARRGDVRAAQLELRRAQNRAEVAREGWALFGEPGEGDRELALNLPQIETAQQQLESAQSQLQQAELDLSRTLVRAPFDAVIEDAPVTLGQRVDPQTPFVTLSGSEHFWVRAVLARKHVDDIAIPNVRGAERGASAVVWQTVGRERVERTGRVLRLLPDLAQEGNMARVLVEVEDPLGRESARLGPLLLRSFVHVDIDARPLEGVMRVPRTALHEGDRVFVAGEDDTLKIRRVDLAWQSPSHVWVRDGLSEGERVVVSVLPDAVPGMKLKVSEHMEGRLGRSSDDGALP